MGLQSVLKMRGGDFGCGRCAHNAARMLGREAEGVAFGCAVCAEQRRKWFNSL